MRLSAPFLLCLPLSAMLAACNPGSEASVSETSAPAAQPSETAAPESEDKTQCGADKLGEFINVLPTSEILDRIKQQSGARTIRVVGPGDVITMDYRIDRLNAETGEDGRIKRFRCY